ncbi:tail assembly protein [Escherichia coli]|nr:tail assembly protein [Escherichia coli]
MARICLYGDLQRFGRRIDLRVKTGAEAIRALATQLPVFRQKLSDGWYQVRIAGRDVSTSGLTAQLHETLPDGAVIHIVPRVAGAKSGGVFQIVLGAAAIAGSFFTAGATLAAWGAAIGAGGMTGILFPLGASMVLGGVAQMLAPKARTPRTQTVRITANRTPISPHWITWLPRAMFCLFCTVKCAWGHAWFLRRSARQTKGTVVRLW